MAASITPYLTLPHLLHSVPILLATTGITVGIRAFTSPLEFAAAFGLPPAPPPTDSTRAHNPFITVAGARNIATGLTIYAFAYQRDWRAVGTVMLCGLVTGVTDAAVCWRHGVRDTAVGHAVVSAVFGGLGAWFVFGTE